MNMKRHLSTVVLAAGLMFAPAVVAQEVKPQDRNAALRYATIAYSAAPDLFAKAGEADVSNAGFDLASAPEVFRAAAHAIEMDSGNTVGQLIEASKLKKCDFEVAWEQGVGALLPHLGRLRADARLLRADARRMEMAGKADEAAERLAAMIRISRHANEDHILISSLVSAAISSLALEETEAALAAGKLTPSARATILDALNTLDKDDPFAMKPAIRGEQRWTLGWVKSAFHGDDAGKKLVATGYLDFPGDAKGSTPKQTNPAVEAIGKMNEKQLHDAADLASTYYDKIIAVWNTADAVKTLETMSKDVENGQYGPIGCVFAPAGSKARASSLKAEKLITDMKQKLAVTH